MAHCAFAEGYLDIPFDLGTHDKVHILCWTQLNWVLMIKWKIYDFPIINANSKYHTVIIFIVYCEKVIHFWFKRSKMSGIYGFLLKIRFGWSYLNSLILILDIIHGLIFNF